MKFDLQEAISVLERTPRVITELLSGLSRDWIESNEGKETWSPLDVVCHLILGEKTDWIPRVEIILNNSLKKDFIPFSMTDHFEIGNGRDLLQLLDLLSELRVQNIQKLKSFDIQDHQWNLTGVHPEFGAVTLKELIATWVAHDLGHIVQISRVMAKHYKEEIGPWKKYLTVVNK